MSITIVYCNITDIIILSFVYLICRLLLIEPVGSGRVKDRNAHLAVRIDIRMEQLCFKLHLRWTVREVFGELGERMEIFNSSPADYSGSLRGLGEEKWVMIFIIKYFSRIQNLNFMSSNTDF
jgi:hypothetical protein